MQGRKSSIELLRIIAMLGVVVLHYNNADIGGAFSGVNEFSLNHWVLIFLECIFVGSVDLFMFISGYFLINTDRRSLKKPFLLIIQVIAFSLGFYFLSVVKGSQAFKLASFFRKLIPTNYFVVLYVTVFIISPFINILLKKLNSKQLKQLLMTLILLLSFFRHFGLLWKVCFMLIFRESIHMDCMETSRDMIW